MCCSSEIGYCDICHMEKPLSRKYYYYDIDCECCNGNTHFEIVRHCKDCTPIPPRKITVYIQPMNERN